MTRQADYVVRAVLYLAQCCSDNPVPTAEIGRQQHIPLTFLAKIISQLSAAGIVHTQRGAHGGVSLGQPPAEISLLDIVETIDGPMLLNACVADPSVCPFGDQCAVHQVWCQAQADLVARLSATNMATLIQPHSRPIVVRETERQHVGPIMTGETHI